MVVRHNDTRRRRIVVDPTTQGSEIGEPLPEKRATKRKASLYRAGSERRNQWKTTDLLPKRVKAIAFLVSALVLIVLSLNLLAVYSPRWTSVLSPRSVATLQLTGTATLATWFSSFLLIVSGFASLQIYALRQHRQDDYRGSYRLWLWMAGLLMFGSINCVVDLSTVVRDAFQAFEFSSFFGKSLSLMILIKIGLLLALVVRGCFEVRESRSSLVLVLLVWFAYFSSMILQLPLVQPVIANVDPEIQKATMGNLLLFGSVFTFLSTTLFARFVYMQALGLIKSRKKKAQRKQAKATVEKVKSKQVRKSRIESTESSQDEKVKSSRHKDSEGSSATRIGSNDTALSHSATSPQTGDSKSEVVKPNPLKANSVKPKEQKTASTLRPASQEDEQDQDQDENILRLSKSERKKNKQQSSQNRRAA